MKYRLITATGSYKIHSYITAENDDQAAGKAIQALDRIERNGLANEAVPVRLTNLTLKAELI